jgi:hypothetical protein
LLDQPFWAARLRQLGVAGTPLPQRDLTADNLAAAIRSCQDEPDQQIRAANLGRPIHAEVGAAPVLAMVNACGLRVAPQRRTRDQATDMLKGRRTVTNSGGLCREHEQCASKPLPHLGSLSRSAIGILFVRTER